MSSLAAAAVLALSLHAPPAGDAAPETSGNPLFEGWYADPEALVFGDEYWIYPTFSARYENQTHFDAFSSKDLVTWTKHENILTADDVSPGRTRAMWAPSAIEKGGRYYFFFGANDIQNDDAVGGIGVAVADSPAGPFEDHLGKPLIGDVPQRGRSRSTSSSSATPPTARTT